MKKIILITLFALGTAGISWAQNYIVVNSEKVFKSLAEYNNAIADLDKLAESYQAQVDKQFEEIESLYNNYMVQRGSMSAAAREARENAILTKEKEATDFQQELFGTDGALIKKRVETIQPIQKRVFDAIEAYASAHSFDLVLDSANNPTLLHVNPKVDHTEQVISTLK